MQTHSIYYVCIKYRYIVKCVYTHIYIIPIYKHTHTHNWVNIKVHTKGFISKGKLHTHIWCEGNISCLWTFAYVGSFSLKCFFNTLCLSNSYLFFKNQLQFHTSTMLLLCWISLKNFLYVYFHYFIYLSLLLDNELFKYRNWVSFMFALPQTLALRHILSSQ